MKRLIGPILVLAMSTAGFAQGESSDLRAELQKHYRLFEVAIAKADFPAFIKLFHPSYSEVNAKGQAMSYVQFREFAKGMMKSTKDVVAKSTVVHAQGGLGGEATAWVQVVMTYKVQQNGKWTALKMTKRYADTLKRGPSGWLFTYSQELPLDEPWPF